MKKKKSISSINIVLVALLIIVVGAGFYFTLATPTPKKAEIPKPRELSLFVLGTDCTSCVNLTKPIVEFLSKQKNLNVTQQQFLTIEESKDLAAKYGIDKLPAIVLTGNTTNLTIQNFKPSDDALVFSDAPAPYYNISAGKLVGEVKITILDDPTCTNCFNVSELVFQLRKAGIVITSSKTVPTKSDEGKKLIAKYKLEHVPTLLLSADALEYSVISDIWAQIGSVENDGTLALRTISPPYVNTTSGKVEGLVELTTLVDGTCTPCVNASAYRDIFENGFRIAFKSNTLVDVSSTKGKTLLKKYNIDLIPTILMSKDAALYPAMQDVWPQVGTIEKDGTFVFRSVPKLENVLKKSVSYKNITSGELLNSSTKSANDASAESVDITRPEEENSTN